MNLSSSFIRAFIHSHHISFALHSRVFLSSDDDVLWELGWPLTLKRVESSSDGRYEVVVRLVAEGGGRRGRWLGAVGWESERRGGRGEGRGGLGEVGAGNGAESAAG